MLERGLALALGLLLTLGMIELGLRLAGSLYDDPAQAVPGEYLPRPGQQVFLSMGDSMTWGVGASRGMAYPDQLQALMASEAPTQDVAMFNGSMAGANTAMVLALLQDFLEVLDPDVVLILVGGNNETNYYGYNAWKRRSPAWVRLDDSLRGIRVLRLARYLSRQLRARSVEQPRILDGVGAGVAACAAWHEAQGRTIGVAFRQGARLLELNRFELAREHFQVAVELAPDDTSLYWGLATAHKGLRDKGRASMAFRRCLHVDPRDPSCHYGLGELVLEGAPREAGSSPQLDAARTRFQQGVEADPSFAANHWGLGMVHMKTNKAPEAVRAFLRCIEADPDDARCYPNLLIQGEMSGEQARVEAVLAALAEQHQVADDYLHALQLQQDPGSVEQWILADLRRMTQLSRAAGAQVILQTYPYENPSNELVRSVALELDLPLADHRSRFLQELDYGVSYEDLFSADRRHCNDRGYALMAATLRDTLLAHATAGGG